MKIIQTQTFSAWLTKLRDDRARRMIEAGVDALIHGYYGKIKVLGGGLRELKIDIGAGYRVYYTVIGDTVVILLCGGNKSTQSRDIKKARAILEEVKRNGQF